MRILTVILLALALGARNSVAVERVSVAAASNLVYALEALNQEFRRSSPDIDLTSTSGASGNLFAQIKNGAPYDVFLSADTDYPQQIVSAGLGDAASLRTFASGRLVFWSTRSDVDVMDIASAIRSTAVKKIAIAQPRVAPYGRAAQAAMEQAGVWAAAEPKLVFGENITQTAQFVETGNADAGFVALSLVMSPRLAQLGRWMEIPAEWYHRVSLDHALVLTQRGATNPAARKYVAFLASDAARKILRDFGYHVP